MALGDALFIIVVSLASNLFIEAISWVLIYRKEEYKDMKDKISQIDVKYEKLKEIIRSKSQPNVTAQKAKLAKYDEMKKSLQGKMTWYNIQSTLCISITMFILYGLMDSRFDGVVVAKLPFEPIPLIRAITHRNLIGEDFTDCSMAFFYLLCSIGFRSTIQKFLGTTPPSIGQSFATEEKEGY